MSALTPSAVGLALAAVASIVATPAAAAPHVAVDVAPVHSLVAAVMAGVGAPDLILTPGSSPHDHALRPSEARALETADLTVWVGPALTPWLAGPLEALGGTAPQVELMALEGMTLLPARTGATFEPHDHEDAHDPAEDEAHEDHGPLDAHLWLDPANATRIASAVAAELAAIDPGNAALYRANAEAVAARNAALTAQIAARLAPLRGKAFLVLHDAYQYFERAFDLPAAGSISTTDGAAPSPGRVSELRARLLGGQVVCVFTEPRFEPKLVGTLVEGTPARIGALDPEGTALPLGPDLYPALMNGLAAALKDCLRG